GGRGRCPRRPRVPGCRRDGRAGEPCRRAREGDSEHLRTGTRQGISLGDLVVGRYRARKDCGGETVRPALLVDVDGPLNPYAAKPHRRPEGCKPTASTTHPI